MYEKKLKIAVVHDHLGFSGGGERTVLLMALHLGADFITAYSKNEVFPEYQKQLGDRLKILSKSVIYMRVVRFFWLRFLFWRKRKIFKNYDILIASSQTATEVVAHYSRKKAIRIVYTHTTPRRVFDLYEISKKMYPFFLQPAYAIFARFWKFIYLRAIRKFNFNIANSENVRFRIQSHTKSDANAVIWPPIMTDRFKFIESGDYFLSFGRLDEAKRIELIVEAFQKMPEKKLIVASGGPRLEKIKKMASGYDNIEIKGWVSDEELVKLVNHCRASIYLPIDEDAGMTHLETNAAGKPYLGVKEGGLIESTIDGQTGILLPQNPKVEDVISGLEKMTKEWCMERKEQCQKQAEKYNENNFYKKIDEVVRENDPRVPILGIDASRWEDPRFPLEHRRTGVEIVSKNVLEEVVKLYKKYNIRLRLYSTRTIRDLPLSLQKVIPNQKQWTRLALARELKTSPVDYFFTPSYYIPITAPKKSFAIVHDVYFKSNPEHYSAKERFHQDFAIFNNIRRSQQIFTVSEHSKSEIINFYGVKEDKITAFPMGHSVVDRRSGNVDRKRDKFILFIGRVEKKKSVDVLIRGFAAFVKKHPEWHLKIAGMDGEGAERIKGETKLFGIADKVDFLGYVSDDVKWDLLSRASLFVHPSIHEGSAIPILEAFDYGVPVVAADTAVIKEVGEMAVVYFKPGDPESLKNRIEFLLSNEKLQETNIAQGRKYLAKRNWDRIVDDILRKILDK